jgi:hypothetical protein
MPKRKLPPIVIGPVLRQELGPDRGIVIYRLMSAGVPIIMDPFGLDDTPIEVQRERWQAGVEALREATS